MATDKHDIKTVRVYKRASGPKVKRAGHFDEREVDREVMDICLGCTPDSCAAHLEFHPREVAISCDYYGRS